MSDTCTGDLALTLSLLSLDLEMARSIIFLCTRGCLLMVSKRLVCTFGTIVHHNHTMLIRKILGTLSNVPKPTSTTWRTRQLMSSPVSTTTYTVASFLPCSIRMRPPRRSRISSTDSSLISTYLQSRRRWLLTFSTASWMRFKTFVIILVFCQSR